jgi:FeS assembly SUF system protein
MDRKPLEQQDDAESVPHRSASSAESASSVEVGTAPSPQSASERESRDAPPPLTDDEIERLRLDIVAALKSVYDPEIPSDIYELGLIYKIDVEDNHVVDILMTLTAPACPVAGEMPKWVEDAVNAVPGVRETKVTLTFDPPWDQSRMSDEARLALNMF